MSALLLAMFVRMAAAETIKARLYPLGQTQGEPLFTQVIRVRKDADGTEHQSSEIADPKGEIVMTEETVYKGVTLITQKMEQRQSGKAWELHVDNTKLTFHKLELAAGARTPAGEESETVKGTLISGPVLRNFVRERWGDLTAGKKIDVRFAVFELESTVGFTLRQKSSDEKTVTIEMRPSALFVSMMVDPIRITFSREDKKIIHLAGRTPLRDKKGKSLDCEIIYEEVKDDAQTS